MTHQDYAVELNKFSYNLSTVSDVSDETVKRVRISRLYYALFHRIIEELPDLQSSSTPSKHNQMLERLTRASGNPHTMRVKQHFQQLLDLRVWADYQPNVAAPNSDMNLLFEKTYRIINSTRIFLTPRQ